MSEVVSGEGRIGTHARTMYSSFSSSWAMTCEPTNPVPPVTCMYMIRIDVRKIMWVLQE